MLNLCLVILTDIMPAVADGMATVTHFVALEFWSLLTLMGGRY